MAANKDVIIEFQYSKRETGLRWCKHIHRVRERVWEYVLRVQQREGERENRESERERKKRGHG